MNENLHPPQWTAGLTDEDWAFLKRFLLASGSLKELAKIYAVSYPTIRLRLDRLIEKVRIHERADEVSPFELRLQSLVADGRLEAANARQLLETHLAALRENGSGGPPPAVPGA